MNTLITQGCSVTDLIDALTAALQPQIETIVKNALKQNEQEKLLGSAEVCRMLAISKPTLNAWSHDGKLKQYRIGKRVYWKYGEIMSALQHLKKYKMTAAA
jgi:excisionase family DNA binding protein